jgi:hypothetical protein
MSVSNLREVFDCIRIVEQDFDLINFRSGGVFIWPVIRLRIIRAICESLEIYAPTPTQPSIFDDGSGFKFETSQALHKKVMSGKVKSEFAIIPFLRRDLKGEDVFTKRILSSLPNSFVFAVGEHDAKTEKLSFEYVSKLYEKQYRNRAKFHSLLRLRIWQLRYWREVIEELEQLTGADLARYRALPKWLMVEFHSQRIGFRKLFKRLGVKKLFYVNAYNSACIAAAKESGAWVVEPQHGLLSSLHSSLSWPESPQVDYQPDEVLVWGKYWSSCTKFAGNVKATLIGWAPAIPASDSINRKSGTVAFISQPEHAQRIAKLALESAKLHPELKFLLKPHPKDSRLDLVSIPNLEVVDPRVNSQILGTRCEFVVGVSSMALVESAVLGAKACVLDLPGREHLDGLVDLGALTLLRGSFSVSAMRERAKPFADSDYLLASELNAEHFKAALIGSR